MLEKLGQKQNSLDILLEAVRMRSWFGNEFAPRQISRKASGGVLFY
jgi:phenylpyruvate tautomerase PptA (4-oxalocrotonate tautomerase family)